MRKFLKGIGVLQSKDVGHRFKRYRINPWNPLSYLTIIIVVIMHTVWYGVKGTYDEVYGRNPFKWQ